MHEATGALVDSHETLKALAPLAEPFIKVAVEKWLSPAIDKLGRVKDAFKRARPEVITKAFEEYLIRTYGRLSFMNTIVFGNQQRRIQDLYVPLTACLRGPERTEFKIIDWRDNFIPAFKRVIITDTAGMGKSTVLKWLFLCCFGASKCIPIFIELRSLSASKTLLDRIYEELCPIDKIFDKEFLLHLIKSGQFIFFLDGFDEIAFEHRRKVTEDIQSFIAKALENLFVITSRHETALASFGEFREFTIKPLSKQEAYQLLRRYDESQEHAEALIAELEESKYEQLKDLMENPMLVSLLYKAYSYKPKVPFKKHIFYRQVFDSLFDMHDATKGGAFVRKKQCNLDIDEFHQVMRDLGFTTAKLGKIEYPRDEISDIIKKVRERNTAVLFQPSALLDDLVTTVPLFNREGEHFKWAHKSVQDYFASQFIALDAKADEVALLTAIYEKGHARRFENILDLLHDTDNKSFRRVLLAKLLEDYIAHYDGSYCHSYPEIDEDLIEERRQLTFGYDIALGHATGRAFNKMLDSSDALDSMFIKLFPKKAKLEIMVFFSSVSPNKHTLQGLSLKPAFGLLPLLAARDYPYIKKARWNPKQDIKLPTGGPHLLSDNPKCVLNSPRHFESVNGALRHHGYHIAIDQVRRTLQTIREEMDDSKHASQLLDNL